MPRSLSPLLSSVTAPESPPSMSPVWGRRLVSGVLGLSTLDVFSFNFILKSNYLTYVYHLHIKLFTLT